MIPSWTFHHPTRVHFGEAGLGQLPTIVSPHAAGRIAILTGAHSAAAFGYLETVQSALDAYDLAHFDQIEPEPSHSCVESAAQFIADAGATVVVALGGGSVIDAAKAATCLAGTGDRIAPYMDRERTFSCRTLPLVALPTTAGTGSEVTPFAVLTNDATGEKKSLPSQYFYPDDAVVIPSLATTVPQKVRGDVGIDALAHAYEALWSINANPVSDALAYQAILTITSAFERYYDEPTAPAAAEMAGGATIAGLAFSNTLTAGCHAISYPLCDQLHISHGAACAITLEHVAELNKDAAREKFAIVARLLGLDSYADVPGAISRLRAHATTIPSLGALGLREEDLPAIARGAFEPLLRNNPVEMTPERIVDVLRLAL